MGELSQLAWQLVLLGAVACICAIGQTGLWNAASSEIVNKLGALYFECIISQDITWFYRHDGRGVLAAAANRNLTLIEGGIGLQMATAIRFTATIIAATTIAFVVNW